MAQKPHPIEYAANKWKNEVWDSCKALWTLWVPGQIINFAFVPRYLRVPFGALPARSLCRCPGACCSTRKKQCYLSCHCCHLLRPALKWSTVLGDRCGKMGTCSPHRGHSMLLARFCMCRCKLKVHCAMMHGMTAWPWNGHDE